MVAPSDPGKRTACRIRFFTQSNRPKPTAQILDPLERMSRAFPPACTGLLGHLSNVSVVTLAQIRGVRCG